MAEFDNLIQIGGAEDPKNRAKASRKRAVKAGGRVKKETPRGCEYCPSKENWKYGINPVKGKVRGKKIFVWAQCPGKNENEQGKELLGQAGKLLWEALESAGVSRSDCDVQNIVRCFTVDVMDHGEYLKMRNPSKQELHCCSLYTDQAIEKSEARVHLVLGIFAQKQLLGAEYKKNARVYFSNRLQAWVVCADHPSFYLRQGGMGAVQDSNRFQDWLKLLAQVPRLAKAKGGRFAYLEKQDYKAVVTAKEARRAYKEILRIASFGGRLSVDFEEGQTKKGKPSEDGTGDPTALVIGFSPKPGMSRVFWLDHPNLPKPRTRKDARVVWKIARRLLESNIPKVFQKGNYDVPATSELMDAEVVNYDYDTEFGEYMAYPDAKAYGLQAIANRRFPQMAGYKEVIVPGALRKDFIKRQPAKLQEAIKNKTANWSEIFEKAKKDHGCNLAKLPWKEMLLYNGADSDIQKRIELSTKHRVHMPLMHVYRDVGFVLARMEKKDSPKFDYRHHALLQEFFPVRREQILKQIRKHVKKILRTRKPKKVVMTRPKKEKYFTLKRDSWKKFNPNSHPQTMDIIYNWLRLPVIETRKNKDRKTGKIKPSTEKEVMTILSEYHELPMLILQYRHDNKVCSTYLDGFYKCAQANEGRLRTKWWLTGTGTGRISSGGGSAKKQTDDSITDVVNLQNIHGDPLLQCLVISDDRWWDLQLWWNEHGPFKSDKDIPEWVWEMDVFLGYDHAQMELRVLAQKSRDKELRRIFSSGDDPHSMVGHELTGWPVERIKNDERVRRIVKNMQFGIVFGLNEDNLFDYMVAKGVYKYSDGTEEGDQLEAEQREEVRKFHRKYFKRFKGVKRMIEEDRAFVEENGYMVTLTGFRRDLDTSGEGESTSYYGNQAVNGPIQGTASHIMLMGLVPLQRKPKKYKLLQHPQLEIHDALYIKLKLKRLWPAMDLGRYMLEKEPVNIMKNDFGIDWQVPLLAEPKAGFRFGVLTKDIHKITGENRTAEFLNQWCAKNKLMMGSLKCQKTSTHKPTQIPGKDGKNILQCTRCGKKLEEKQIA